MMRLDKFLAAAHQGTRREVKALIAAGRVTVDGIPIRRPEQQLDPDAAAVRLDGREVRPVGTVYYMLHKPAGVVSATQDRQRTVIDLFELPHRRELFPVGRLDKDTEGLLLITNDGAFAHRLMSPARHVEKLYLARLDGPVPDRAQAAFAAGVDIGTRDTPELTRPARLEQPAGGPENEAWVTVTEGKYHQIKRMFQAVGCEVIYLKRLRIGPLALDETLAPGEYRPLSAAELAALQSR